jgi:hypothetical protein
LILIIFTDVGRPYWAPWVRRGDGYLRFRWLGLEAIFYSPGAARVMIEALDGG